MVVKRTIVEIALILAFMVSLGVNVSLNDTGELVDEGYIPYSCDKDTVPDMMCYKLSRVNDAGIQRNCYYNRDKTRSYKVCSTGWERIEPTIECPLPTCPEQECVDNYTPCPTCPSCPKITCPSCPSTSCSSSCPVCSTCPLPDDCGDVLVLAYTDDGKYFCNGIGYGQICIHEGDLSEEDLAWLGW